jgi:hypothetical protein
MLLLEDLLDGYERLADEESAFAQAQSNYALSIILLRRTTGTLLRSRYDAPELEPDETDYMTSRADQAATGNEARASRTVRTASMIDQGPVNDDRTAPASWSQPVGRHPVREAAPMTAPTPHRRGENTAPQGEQSFGGHSFGKGN